MNFRLKGGRFYNSEDVQKIYGLSKEDYLRLKPFIRIPAEEDHGKLPPLEYDSTKIEEQNSEDDGNDFPIPLNEADTNALKTIPGIGPYFAKAIVRHRENLGGFIRKNQIMEIKYLDREKFEKVETYLYILDSTQVRKIDINAVEIQDLAKHPYLNYKLAQNLVKYRNQHGSFEKLEDLENLVLWHDSIIGKIAPYIEFQ